MCIMFHVRFFTRHQNRILVIFIRPLLEIFFIGTIFGVQKKIFTNFFSRRWHHLHGVKSVLSVGTDEHGQKIIRTANQLGYDHPQNLVDEVSQEYIKTFHKFNISFERGM